MELPESHGWFERKRGYEVLTGMIKDTNFATKSSSIYSKLKTHEKGDFWKRDPMEAKWCLHTAVASWSMIPHSYGKMKALNP